MTRTWNKLIFRGKFVNKIRISTVTSLVINTAVYNMLNRKLNIFIVFDF